MTCIFCLKENTDSWFGSYCIRCHKLQRMIALFSIDKIMDVLESVLLVSPEVQIDKIKEELKTELTTREYSLRARKVVMPSTLPKLM